MSGSRAHCDQQKGNILKKVGRPSGSRSDGLRQRRLVGERARVVLPRRGTVQGLVAPLRSSGPGSWPAPGRHKEALRTGRAMRDCPAVAEQPARRPLGEPFAGIDARAGRPSTGAIDRGLHCLDPERQRYPVNRDRHGAIGIERGPG